MQLPKFSDIEETISFWTRNDFGIANNLLIGNMDLVWEIAEAAYNDNKGILKEYEDGIRTIHGDYDKKWIKSLKSRLIDNLDTKTKANIISIAKKDIINILNAMKPAEYERHLYRTAWRTDDDCFCDIYPYAHQYKKLKLHVNDIIEIKIISSSSVNPYRENDGINCDFYRYEITVPKNMKILELDQFECHNEEGEVLLPPMKCKVINIHNSSNVRCRGIIELEYIEELVINNDIKFE
ncbi:MAG: hypothetical protein ACYCYI_03520 [Saccharofermentanales bacterium]